MTTTTQQPNSIFVEILHRQLTTAFDECDAYGYINAMNSFIRPTLDELSTEQRNNLFNILKLMELLPLLERYHTKLLE